MNLGTGIDGQYLSGSRQDIFHRDCRIFCCLFCLFLRFIGGIFGLANGVMLFSIDVIGVMCYIFSSGRSSIESGFGRILKGVIAMKFLGALLPHCFYIQRFSLASYNLNYR